MGAFSWMSNDQYLAQVGHFLGGLAIVFVAGAFGGHAVMWWVLGIGLALAAAKEFIFDTASWGEGDSWSDSLMDFAFYLLGGLAGMGLFLLAVAQHATFN
jgi:hypothetical protein